MKVDKALIEKYHKGECSPEESAAVENWLLDDDTEIEIILPKDLQKENVKSEMWENISSSLSSSKDKKRPVLIRFSEFNRFGMAAAASLLLVAVFSFILFKVNQKESVITSINASLSENKEIDSRDYTISLGPESNARIDANTGLIDFCGTILISPKKDINLSFKDICTTTKGNTGKMNFKKGETYIALNYRNKKDNELIVMDEKLLMGLPPIVKRQIMDQFNI